MGITGAAADAKFLLGGDLSAMKGLADTAGRLANVYKDASPEDLTDIALKVQQEVGRYGGKLNESGFRSMEQLTALGMAPDQAVAMGLAAVRGGGSPEALRQLTKAASDAIDISKVPVNAPGLDANQIGILRGRKAEQMGVVAYNAADDATRLQMLLANPNLRDLTMETQGSLDLENMLRQGPGGLAQGLAAARAGDYVGGETAAAMAGRGREAELIRAGYVADASAEKARLGDMGYLEEQVREKQMVADWTSAGMSDFEIDKRMGLYRTGRFADSSTQEVQGLLREIKDAIVEQGRRQAERDAQRGPLMTGLAAPDYSTGMLY